MSYDITLTTPDGQIAHVPSHEEGGTFVLGGTTDARVSITYNYAPYYRAHLDAERGIRWLYGQTGGAVAGRLAAAIAAILADEATEARLCARPDGPTGYWEPTRANAARALEVLLGWALQYPDATFDGD